MSLEGNAMQAPKCLDQLSNRALYSKVTLKVLEKTDI